MGTEQRCCHLGFPQIRIPEVRTLILLAGTTAVTVPECKPEKSGKKVTGFSPLTEALATFGG
jgi:hypothetical protein